MKKVSLFIVALVITGVAIFATSSWTQVEAANKNPYAVCVMDDYANNVQKCKPVGNSGWYVTVSNNKRDIYCARVVNDIAKECIFMTYGPKHTPQQYCRVEVKSKYLPQPCAKVGHQMNAYRTTSGQTIDMFCSHPGTPYATGCHYNNRMTI